MQVITLVDGQEVPRTVKWVGHRRIDLTKRPRSEAVAPIRVEWRCLCRQRCRTAICCCRRITRSSVDGKLICVRQLVNGSTIRMEREWTAVDYYHVELDRHAIVLAEGLSVESYLDTGNRAFFTNSGLPPVLHPDLPNDAIYPTRAKPAPVCAVRMERVERAAGMATPRRSGRRDQPTGAAARDHDRMPTCDFSSIDALSGRPSAIEIASFLSCRMVPAKWS